MSEHDVKAREICFLLYCGDKKLVDGRFTVLAKIGTSCFGDYREFPIGNGERAAAIFEGVLLEHSLVKDGGASISLRYLAASPDETSPCKYSQVEVLKAGLSMGVDSGAQEVESVMLGNSHEFVFRTHTLA